MAIRRWSGYLGIVLPIVLTAAAFAFPAEAQNFRYSQIRGTLFYVDRNGEFSPYPEVFPGKIEDLESALHFKFYDFSEENEVPADTRTDFSKYSGMGGYDLYNYLLLVGTEYVSIKIVFDHMGYTGDNQTRIRRHLDGIQDVHINIRKKPASAEELSRRVSALVLEKSAGGSSGKQYAKDTTDTELEYLIQDVMDTFLATGDPALLQSITLLVERAMVEDRPLSRATLQDLDNLDRKAAFKDQQDYDRFLFYRDLGRAFAESRNPFRFLQPDFTRYDQGQAFRARGLDMVQLEGAEIGLRDYLLLFQEQYRSACSTGDDLDCLRTQYNGLEYLQDQRVNARTMRSFLTDYLNRIEKVTKYGPANGGSDVSRDAFVKRMAVGMGHPDSDGELWEEAYFLITSSERYERMFNRYTRFRKARQLMEDIIASAETMAAGVQG